MVRETGESQENEQRVATLEHKLTEVGELAKARPEQLGPEAPALLSDLETLQKQFAEAKATKKNVTKMKKIEKDVDLWETRLHRALSTDTEVMLDSTSNGLEKIKEKLPEKGKELQVVVEKFRGELATIHREHKSPDAIDALQDTVADWMEKTFIPIAKKYIEEIPSASEAKKGFVGAVAGKPGENSPARRAVRGLMSTPAPEPEEPGPAPEQKIEVSPLQKEMELTNPAEAAEAWEQSILAVPLAKTPADFDKIINAMAVYAHEQRNGNLQLELKNLDNIPARLHKKGSTVTAEDKTRAVEKFNSIFREALAKYPGIDLEKLKTDIETKLSAASKRNVAPTPHEHTSPDTGSVKPDAEKEVKPITLEEAAHFIEEARKKFPKGDTKPVGEEGISDTIFAGAKWRFLLRQKRIDKETKQRAKEEAKAVRDAFLTSTREQRQSQVDSMPSAVSLGDAENVINTFVSLSKRYPTFLPAPEMLTLKRIMHSFAEKFRETKPTVEDREKVLADFNRKTKEILILTPIDLKEYQEEYGRQESKKAKAAEIEKPVEPATAESVEPKGEEPTALEAKTVDECSHIIDAFNIYLKAHENKDLRREVSHLVDFTKEFHKKKKSGEATKEDQEKTVSGFNAELQKVLAKYPEIKVEELKEAIEARSKKTGHAERKAKEISPERRTEVEAFLKENPVASTGSFTLFLDALDTYATENKVDLSQGWRKLDRIQAQLRRIRTKRSLTQAEMDEALADFKKQLEETLLRRPVDLAKLKVILVTSREKGAKKESTTAHPAPLIHPVEPEPAAKAVEEVVATPAEKIPEPAPVPAAPEPAPVELAPVLPTVPEQESASAPVEATPAVASSTEKRSGPEQDFKGFEYGVVSEKDHPINEDSYLTAPELGLYAVFDGLGGHNAGDVASRRAAELLKEKVTSLATDLDLNEMRDVMEQIVRDISAQIETEAAGNPDWQGMATTVSLLKFFRDQDGKMYAIAIHAGDSRTYEWSQNKLRQIGRDHNTLRDLYESEGRSSSEIDRDQALLDDVDSSEKMKALPRELKEHYLNRNVITSTLGDSTTDLDIEIVAVEPGSRFILTTDGVHDTLARTRIQQILETNNSDAQATAAALVAEVKAAVRRRDYGNKPDDTTALVVDPLGKLTVKTVSPAPIEAEPEPVPETTEPITPESAPTGPEPAPQAIPAPEPAPAAQPPEPTPAPAPVPRVEATPPPPPPPVAPRVEAIPPAAPREEQAPEMSEAERLEIRWEMVGKRLADFRTIFFTNDKQGEELRKNFGASLAELDDLFYAIPVTSSGQPEMKNGKRLLSVIEGHLTPLETEANDLIARRREKQQSLGAKIKGALNGFS